MDVWCKLTGGFEIRAAGRHAEEAAELRSEGVCTGRRAMMGAGISIQGMQ